MNRLVLFSGICASLLLYKVSLAQCPTAYYSSVATTSGGNGFGVNSLSNPENLVDGNLNTFALITSNNSTPATPTVFFIDITLNATIPANTFFYMKVNDASNLAIQTYNGATAINTPDITVTTKTVYGFTFFELKSTQPVTRFRVTFTNSAGLQTRQLYEFYSGVPCDTPLPVSLTSFTAKPLNNSSVQINWTTGMERSNDYFQLERSKDLIQFDAVIRIKASEGSQGSTYAFTDERPYAGTSYYRLRQVDLTGETSVFPAVSVVIRPDAYGVFPNPVVNDERFSLRLDEPQTANIHFFSADGRTLPIQKVGVESGNLVLKTAGKLSAGVYILTVEERGQTRKHRFVVE